MVDRSSTVPVLMYGSSITLDAAGANAYVIESVTNSVFRVRLSTGARTLISSAQRGTGVALNRPTDIVIHATDGEAYVLDAGLRGLVRVNLSTGERVLVSGATRGSGEGFVTPLDCFCIPPVARPLCRTRTLARLTGWI